MSTEYNAGGPHSTRHHFPCDCLINFGHTNLTIAAHSFPISKELASLPGAHQPALSHYEEPDAEWRFVRLHELQALMVKELVHADRLSAWEAVLGLHDRKGTLIVVL